MRSFDPFGAETSATANGNVEENITEVDLRIKTSTGEVVLIQGVRAAVSNGTEDLVIGMSVLKYFSLLFKGGSLVDLRFDEKSVG